MKVNDRRGLNRRELTECCLALGLAAPTISIAAAPSVAEAPVRGGVAVSGPERTVKFRDGTVVRALGQGSARLGQGRHNETVEEEALREGISLGMTLIDTSEGYSNGRSEELIGRAIAGQRDRVFLVSKVDRATDIAGACEASLARLGTNYLDLYLLHWPMRGADLSAVVAAFESLRMSGKIRAWGVSNFQVGDMEDLFRVPDGHRCATNQVLYNLSSRRIERDLLPWCEQRGMPVMAYSPLGSSSLVHDATLTKIGAADDCAATAVALAWVIRSGNVIAIPESGSPAHVKENAVALSLTLTPQELQALDAAYPTSSMDFLRSLKDRGKRWLRSFPIAK